MVHNSSTKLWKSSPAWRANQGARSDAYHQTTWRFHSRPISGTGMVIATRLNAWLRTVTAIKTKATGDNMEAIVIWPIKLDPLADTFLF